MTHAAAALLALAMTPDVVPPVDVEIVALDVVVVDGDGRPARGLGPDDFEILEDGKPQRLVQFRPVTTGRAPLPGAEPAAPAATVDPRAEDVAEPPPAAPRHIAIVVDDLHIGPGNLEPTRQALAALVDDLVGPEDLVALVTTSSPGGVHALTRDRAALRQAIQQLAINPAPVVARGIAAMTPAQAELILRGDRNAIDVAVARLMTSPGSRFSNAPSAEAERGAEEEVVMQARGVLSEALRFSTASLDTLADVVRSLATAPGRKICLLVSDGFLVGTGTAEERTRDMREIVDAATRSGAVVYTLDSRGLVTGVVDASVAASNVPPDMQRRLDRQEEHLVAATLQRVAQETGGLWLRGTNDPASGLRQMLQDNEVYYLLAYEPANTRRDGRFRKIQVRLPRHRGFVARTRSGYFAADERKRPKAPPAPPAKPRRTLDASLGLDEEAARTALAAPLAPGGVPVAMTADYVDLPPDGPQAVVNAEVDLGAVRWQHVGGRLRASMQVAVGVYDADGRLVKPPLGRRAELDAAPGEQDRATRGGLRYQERVALGPGRYQVRVVALPADGAPAGGAARWLEIPDLRDGRLALSSVFLSPPQRRFRRNDTMTFQVYVYNARRGDVDLQAQIRSGETVIAASRPKAAVIEERNGARLPETNEMKLEGLERGSYRLRVVVADKKTGTATFQDVDFVVE